MGILESTDLSDVVAELVRQHGDNWLDMPTIWQLLQKHHPDDAQRIIEHVQSYDNPVRNNEVWFTYWICYQASKSNEFEFSNVN